MRERERDESVDKCAEREMRERDVVVVRDSAPSKILDL